MERKEQELQEFLKRLKVDYGNELPHLIDRVREEVEHGLTNALLIDEVFYYFKEPTTEEGKKIINKLHSGYVSVSGSTEVSNVFYDLRRIYEILTTLNRYIND